MGRMLAMAALVMGAGCGSDPKPQTSYPKLSDEPSETAEQTASSDSAPNTPSSEAECIAPGVYSVGIEVRDDMVEVVGPMATEWCKSIIEGLAYNALREMRLSEVNGALVVEWPDKLQVTDKGRCEFDIKSPMYGATVQFADGKGAGTVGYAVGSPNHPDERCILKDGKITITPLAATPPDGVDGSP